MRHRILMIIAAAIGIGLTASANAQSKFVTLGTAGGAIPMPTRSQPASLLICADHTILIDAGDGVSEQLGKIGEPLRAIDSIFLTHLHFDHTGGLFGFLGLRFQIRTTSALTIYGPPGTQRLMQGLIDAMRPGGEVGGGFPGQVPRSPEAGLRVVEIHGGDGVDLGSVKVTSATNTHYSYPAGSPEALQFQSLAYRFECPDRTIAVTGDTGPSPAVAALAHDADLLVSEVIDPDDAMAQLRKANPSLPPAVAQIAERHMREQHLTPIEVGRLARAATGIKKILLIHNALASSDIEQAMTQIQSEFPGPVVFANDLDQF